MGVVVSEITIETTIAVESVTASDPRFVFRFLTADEVEQFAGSSTSFALPPAIGNHSRGAIREIRRGKARSEGE